MSYSLQSFTVKEVYSDMAKLHFLAECDHVAEFPPVECREMIWASSETESEHAPLKHLLPTGYSPVTQF